LVTLRRSVAILAAFTLACGDASSDPTARTAPPSRLLGLGSPSLVECPTTGSATTQGVIGTLGGTLSVGGATVIVPAGALLGPTQLVVTVPASRYMEIDVSVPGVEHFVFQQPITVSVDYGRCARGNIDTRLLSIWYIDSQSKQPLEPMVSVDNKLTRTITFTTGHLSGYALAD
jgi:hypothetical protein